MSDLGITGSAFVSVSKKLRGCSLSNLGSTCFRCSSDGVGAPAEAVSLERSTVLDLRDGCIDLIGEILTGLLSEVSVDDDVGACKLVDEVPSTGT